MVCMYSDNHGKICLSTISEVHILDAIKKVKNKFTAGVDNIQSFLIKDCAVVFVKPRRISFIMILKTCSYPDIWQISKICPTLKSGDASVTSTYRPKEILCNFSKVFETILYDHIIIWGSKVYNNTLSVWIYWEKVDCY